MRKLVLTALLTSMLCSPTFAGDTPPILSQPDPDSPIGARNPDGAPGLGQYDFLIGDWDADITWTPPGGQEVRYRAKWHNIWAVNGYVVIQEWRGPYQTGAEIRSYDTKTDSWSGYNIYPTLRGWKKVTAKAENGGMAVIIEGASDERGEFLNRETYYDVAPGSFKMKSEKSYDGGENWEPGNYVMTVTRADR